MNNTTKAWLITHTCTIYSIIALCLAVFTFALSKESRLEGVFIFYFFILLGPWFLEPDAQTKGQILFKAFLFLCLKGLFILCLVMWLENGNLQFPAIVLVVTILDFISSIFGIIWGVRIGKWTYFNIDEILPRRKKWRESKVQIMEYSLYYSINRGIVYGCCVCNSVSLLLLAIVACLR